MAEKRNKAPRRNGALRKRRPEDNLRERLDRAKDDHFSNADGAEWDLEQAPPSHRADMQDFAIAWRQVEARRERPFVPLH